MKLVDLVPLKEQENTVAPQETKVKVDILGDEQEVTIKTTPGKGLDDVTISWNEPWGEEVHIVDFEAGDVIDDHGNKGKDMEFIAKASFGPESSHEWVFILDVYVGANYENSGNIEDWDWDTLIIDDHKDAELDIEDEKYDDRGRQIDMEEDVDEGTCGYSIDGEGGDEPAGPHLLKKSNLQERFQQLAGLKPLYEQGFDDRFKDAMGDAGFSDEEQENVFGQDILPDFDENDVKNIEDEAKVAENYEKTEYIVEILLPVTVPHFLLGLGAQDENGREEIAQKIADFYRKKIEHPKAYTGAVEKRNPAR